MFQLATPGRYRLVRAPLVQAVVQVRFPLIAHLQTAEGIAAVQDRLRGRYPYMTQRHEVAVQLPGQPGGAPGIAGGSVWELSDDEGRVVVISAGSASLVVGSTYAGVEEFAGRLDEVLAVLTDVEQVPRCDRLGVSYLSIVSEPPGDGEGWRTWFRSELTGWSASDLLDRDTTVHVALSQVQIEGPPPAAFEGRVPSVRASIQHGFVPEGAGIPGIPPVTTPTPSYVLSVDLAAEAPQPFDRPALGRQFAALHAEIDAFFRWTLTPEGERYFGYEEIT